MKELTLLGAVSGITPSGHPGLARGRFIFCDDQPNNNKQGIKYEDFPEIKATLIGSPVKMRFLGAGVSGHTGSIPIGHIDGFTEEESNGIHTLIAECVLYADDYPDEVEYLRTAFAEGKAPGVSYEVSYHNSIIEDGVEWVKGLAARAATFVKSPAYGNRTRLLALASDKEFMTELLAVANEIHQPTTDKGGNNRMTDEEIQKLKDDLASTKTALAEKTTEVTEKEGIIQTLTTEKETLTTSLAEKDTTIAEFKTKEILASRQETLAQAGISVEIKPERLVKMAEEDFTAYVEDLKLVLAASKAGNKKLALASSRDADIPRFRPTDMSDTGLDLATKFKSLSRSNAAAADTE